jgi:hypothetical protein
VRFKAAEQEIYVKLSNPWHLSLRSNIAIVVCTVSYGNLRPSSHTSRYTVDTYIMKSRLHQIAIIGIALLGSAAFAIGQTQTINSVPYTISSPGSYALGNDIISHADAKISITASNVVLDLGGHTLQVSSTDECILIGFGPPPAPTNVTIKNGALINNVAGCIFVSRAVNLVIDHVSATAAGQCAIFDQAGINNQIKNCTISSGQPTSPQGPIGCRGPGFGAIELLGCSDLIENNVITSAEVSAIATGSTGCAASPAGNVLRNNIIYADSADTENTLPALYLNYTDVYIGNLFPGRPAGATNVTGGVHATE